MKKTIFSLCLINFGLILCFSQINFKDGTVINSSASGSYDMDSGNLDADNLKDIVVVNRTTNDIEIYKNDLSNSGTFIKQPEVINTLETILGVAIADFNGDGFNDIVATGGSNRTVAWYPNNGSGVFATENIITNDILGAPIRVVTGLIDNNSSIDIAVADYSGNRTVWFANNGSGGFSSPNIIGNEPDNSGTFDLDLADYDGDGDTDVVVANQLTSIITIYDNELVQNGDGTVTFRKYDNDINTGENTLQDVDFADVNDDNILDIIEVSVGGPAIPTYYTRTTSNTATAFVGNDLTTALNRLGAVEVADFNNDGYNDVLLSSAQTTNSDESLYDLVILESNNDGTFKDEVTVANANNLKSVYAITVDDFGNDGDLDIATAAFNSSATVSFFLNDLNNLSLSDIDLNEVRMYPNPVNDILSFSGILKENIGAIIYNNIGQVILDYQMDAKKQLDVTSLQAGMYFLKLKEVTKTFKFIKQ